MRELTESRLAVHRAVNFGGNASNGSNTGLACVNSNNAPSTTNTNYGSRLYCLLHLTDTGEDRVKEQRPHLLVKKLVRLARCW